MSSEYNICDRPTYMPPSYMFDQYFSQNQDFDKELKNKDIDDTKDICLKIDNIIFDKKN